MPIGAFINVFPPAVFLLVHLVGFLIGAYFAYRAFGAGLNTFGWAFTLYALAEIVYMTYHLVFVAGVQRVLAGRPAAT